VTEASERSPGTAAAERTIGKIDRIEERTVRIPFISPFSTSTATWAVKQALLLRIEGDGFTGWGECVADPDPFYAPETTTSASHIIRQFLLPLLESELTIAELLVRFERVRGNRMAKATVENALLDLVARREGIPLHELLGFRRKPIPSGISIGIHDSADSLLEAVGEAVRAGYHRVKLKIRRGCDIERVAAVRARFPRVALMVDANGDYSLDDAVHLARLDALGLTMIEQPLSDTDIRNHSTLQQMIETPVCLDESIHSLEDARTAIALNACKVLNVKQGRVGGLIEAMRIAGCAAHHGIPVWSGGMDETGIGRAMNIHLQTMSAFTLPGDTSETRRYFERDIVTPPVVLGEGGFIAIPEGAGTGVEIDLEALEEFTLRSEWIR